MEHTSAIVYDGALLHESSYPQRSEKYNEIELYATHNGIRLSGKIDFYDAKEKVIHETKKGKTTESAHEWQVQFYVWLFALNGMDYVTGKIEYPKLRKTTEVLFSTKDKMVLENSIPIIKAIMLQEKCPPLLNAPICKKCAYYELCYIDEL